MAKEQDLSSYAAFNLDDLLAEIGSQQKSSKEVTAYLDRDFIVNTIKEYKEEALVNRQEFTVDTQIDFTDYNFTGADLTGFTKKELEIFNFTNCDISDAKLDRISLEFFREYFISNKITYKGIILDNAYLGPTHTKRVDLGIECYMYLNLSNMDLMGVSFKNADIDGLILFNTNITGCNFINTKNMDPKQFAFAIGFEKAKFRANPQENSNIIEQISKYSTTLTPDIIDDNPSQRTGHSLLQRIADLNNFFDN